MHIVVVESEGGYGFRPRFTPVPGDEARIGPAMFTVGGLVPPVVDGHECPWATVRPLDDIEYRELRREETSGVHGVKVSWYGDDPMGAFLKVAGTDLDAALAMWYRHAAEIESPWGIE